MAKSISILFVSVFFSFSSLSLAGTVGDRVLYKVDKDKKRTSKSIKRGTSVVEVLDHTERSDLYDNKVDYDFKIRFIGVKKGTNHTEADSIYYDKAFIEKLRKEGELSYPEFKVRHMGYEDVKTLDGKTYLHCDKLHFSNVDMTLESKNPVVGFMKSLSETIYPRRGEGSMDMQKLKDPEVDAWVHPDVKAMGVVKFNARARYMSFNLKVGMDYIAR